MRRRALVSGCFDLLHSGHVEFLQRAAVYGDLYVSVGSDATVVGLKGKRPVCGQDERVFMLRALSCVCDAFVASGTGQLDFLPDMDRIKPDLFIVNDDGETWAKHQVCADRGIGYVVLPRDPHKGLPARSTTALRGVCEIPYRIDLAGGWLDQPWVSQHAPGSVITLSIEPTREFNHRSGMATSTREKARQMWGSGLPDGDRLEIARNLFGAENPPGTPEVAGSQDAIGIVAAGLMQLWYDGEYWPKYTAQCIDERTLSWLDRVLWLVELPEREDGFKVLRKRRTGFRRVRKLAQASLCCWEACASRDTAALGRAITDSFDAQRAMFPLMAQGEVLERVQAVQRETCGAKLCGAGGGGYILAVSDRPVSDGFQITARRGTT